MGPSNNKILLAISLSCQPLSTMFRHTTLLGYESLTSRCHLSSIYVSSMMSAELKVIFQPYSSHVPSLALSPRPNVIGFHWWNIQKSSMNGFLIIDVSSKCHASVIQVSSMRHWYAINDTSHFIFNQIWADSTAIQYVLHLHSICIASVFHFCSIWLPSSFHLQLDWPTAAI